jgi:hypothetical protein
MNTPITFRDGGPYGPDLDLPAAIARLCDGQPVTVTPIEPGTPDGGPRGEPRPGFDITVYPARTAFQRLQPPTVNWAGIGSRPAADAALYAQTLTLASQLATYASLSPANPAPADVTPAWAAPPAAGPGGERVTIRDDRGHALFTGTFGPGHPPRAGWQRVTPDPHPIDLPPRYTAELAAARDE